MAIISIQALREQKAALAKEARNMIEQKGDRRWSAEEQKLFDQKADDMERLDQEILNLQRVMDQEAKDNFRDLDQFRNNKDDKREVTPQRKLFDKLLREGLQALSREEVDTVRNTMSTTTPNQGGYTVETSVAQDLVDLLKAYGGMRQVASSLVTAQGNPLSYPSSDGTSETGEWVPENTQAGSADVTFGTVALNTFKASSKVITIPMELLQDTSIDILALVNNRIRDRLGRTFNAGFTNGTGTGQPFGLIPRASVGKVGANGQTTTVTYDDLVDLQESVDQAYQDGGTCRFMLHQQMRKVVRKIKDGSGRPIWADSYESGIKTGIPAQLLGSDVQINNDMAQPAANAVSLAYGDMSKYMIRDVLALTLFRFDDSAFVTKGQIGFLAWARAGGNLLDPNAVKTYQHSAT
jgi:HK97 family phage major capsid protein